MSTSRWRLQLGLAAVGLVCFTRAQVPLLYVPFDGTPEPALRAGGGNPPGAGSVGPGLAYVSGRRGQAVTITADCRIPSAGTFHPESGTVAFWVRPHWAGSEARNHTLFCLYGHESVPEPWLHNRWSLVAQGGRLTGSFYGAATGQRAELAMDISAWRADEWHHLALTWDGVNSGTADAVFTLSVDGRRVQRLEGRRLDAGKIGDVLDVGRDSDASPDYAEADIDELYVYAEALPEATIARAVGLADQPDTVTVLPPTRSACGSDWWHGAWRLRCRVTATALDLGAGARPTVRLPLDLGGDLASLGLAAAIDPGSYRLLPCAAATGEVARGTQPLPVRLDGDALVWTWPESAPPGQPFSAWLYAGTSALDLREPLFVRRVRTAWPDAAETSQPPLQDYATVAYGDAWDFDEGDLEEIDQWGNKPEFVRNRQVKDGVLSMDVATDPWFIWGDMWGQVPRSRRAVAIDLGRFPVLRLRLRQSCPSARWDLYGRVGTSPDLIHHPFTVRGTGWQTVRIDLAKEAGWGGTLSAFRIDPTSEVAAAHVEIDWVQLVNDVAAGRSPLECLGRPGVPAPTQLAVTADRLAAVAGSRQVVLCRALDADGSPVAGWPLTLRVDSQSDGRLDAAPGQPSLTVDRLTRRAVTATDGTAQFVLVAGRRAAPASDRLRLTAAVSTATAALAVDTVTGPAHHYRVEPAQVTVLRRADLPVTLTAQIEDEAGNALPVPGRTLTFALPEGATLDPAQPVTDNQGRARARLSLDPAKRWVWRLEAADNEGLKGIAGALVYLPDGPRPDPIRLLPNGYFADSAGRPFLPLGGFYANWVQSETPDGEWRTLRSFTDTTDEDKRAWMRFLADSGVTAMRFMLRTHRPNGMEPLDIGGRVNPELFAEAVRYLDLAREFNLRFQLVVHEDYTKPVYVNRQPIEQFALRQYSAAQLAALPPYQRRFLVDRAILSPAGARYTDPDAIACQDQYARELTTALLGNPQVFSYELENEMVNCPASWANHAIGVIQEVDKDVLVGVSHGGGGLHTGDPLWWHRNVRLGYYNYHLYPSGTTSAAMDYGAAVDVLARYGRMAGVCFLGESAGDEFQTHPSRETRRWVMRDIIWMALTNGNPGVFFWNARGAEVREFRLAREAMAKLDLATFRRARPAIAIAVSHPLDDDKYYRTPQGAKDYAMMGRYAGHYLALGVETDFTVDPKPAGYPQHCSLAEFAPPEPASRPFRAGPGWQLKYLAREDWQQVLVYVRNVAGIEPWRPRPDRGATLFLRTRQPAPLSLDLALSGDQPFAAAVYDLDTETTRTLTVPPTGSVELGTTDHDWVLVLQRK